MLVGTRSSRTEYVAVLMMLVVRVRGRRRWSRLDVDWKETALATDMEENRPAEEVRLDGGSDEE